MSERRCPVCGDPRPYVLWRGSMEPPCIYGAHVVTECSHQMGEVRRLLVWQQIAPQCHGPDGNVLPGKFSEAFQAVAAAGFNPWTGEHQPREVADE